MTLIRCTWDISKSCSKFFKELHYEYIISNKGSKEVLETTAKTCIKVIYYLNILPRQNPKVQWSLSCAAIYFNLKKVMQRMHYKLCNHQTVIVGNDLLTLIDLHSLQCMVYYITPVISNNLFTNGLFIHLLRRQIALL